MSKRTGWPMCSVRTVLVPGEQRPGVKSRRHCSRVGSCGRGGLGWVLKGGECRGWCWWGQAAASKRAMTGDQLAKAENVAGNVTLGERLIRAFGDTREDGRPARV